MNKDIHVLGVSEYYHHLHYLEINRNASLKPNIKLMIKGVIKKKGTKEKKSYFEIEGCPGCSSRSFYKRKTIKPLYKCSKCGKEFDEFVIIREYASVGKFNPKTQMKKIKEIFGDKSETFLFKYIILKDISSSDNITINCSNYKNGEMLYLEDIGTKVQVSLGNKTSGGWYQINEYNYHGDYKSEDDLILEKQKRQEHRHRTFHLYPLVYKRDNYQCIECKSKKNIEIHHRNYNFENSDEENLKSMCVLCDKCHEKLTREQIKAERVSDKQMKLDFF